MNKMKQRIIPTPFFNGRKLEKINVNNINLSHAAVKWLLYYDKTIGNIYLEWKQDYYEINDENNNVFVYDKLQKKYFFMNKNELYVKLFAELNKPEKTYKNDFFSVEEIINAFNTYLNNK